MRDHTTIAMSKRYQIISLMLLLAVVLSGCAESGTNVIDEPPTPPVVVEEPTGHKEPVSLLLACAPASSAMALTRLADEVVQSGTTYRTISDFRVLAKRKTASGATFSDSSVDTPEKQIDYTESPDDYQYYHSGYCSMVEGVNACLVYAKAATSTSSATKAYNGSLRPDINAIPTWISSTDQIRFTLEPILDATVARETGNDREAWETEVWALANALTAIVDAAQTVIGDNTYAWKTSTNIILKNLFQRFTNNGADLPGSAASVKQWMLALAAAAEYYHGAGLVAVGDNEKAILAIIKTQAETAAAAVTGTYPRGINLPDGAAVVRWTGEKFEPQMQTTTLDNINSVSRFVYPPALYYFVDSDIVTSTDVRNYKDYAATQTWSTFLTTYFTGDQIASTTQTAAVEDPLQYGVAHLAMRVKASDEELEYGEGSEHTIAISDLTLTGVIIGGQRPVGYDFKPTDVSTYDVSFIYDSQVNGTLTTSYAPYHTLALESVEGENVNIILEFQYADGEGKTEFKSLDGYVYPGTRFYLVGEADLTDKTTEADYTKRVFTQDYTTTVEMTVTSLEKAYNVLPSILSNNLEIGVMTTPQWIAAEPPETVVMD
ncbi:MAG: hypothetical protein IJQ13_08065 [Prevotella sp.]|nr:hypothetical protein [Prevotella sp.]